MLAAVCMAPNSKILMMSKHACCPHPKASSGTHALLTEVVSCMQEVQELQRQLDMPRQQNVSAGQHKEVHVPSDKAQLVVAAALQVPSLMQCMLCASNDRIKCYHARCLSCALNQNRPS